LSTTLIPKKWEARSPPKLLEGQKKWNGKNSQTPYSPKYIERKKLSTTLSQKNGELEALPKSLEGQKKWKGKKKFQNCWSPPPPPKKKFEMNSNSQLPIAHIVHQE